MKFALILLAMVIYYPGFLILAQYGVPFWPGLLTFFLFLLGSKVQGYSREL